MIFTFWFFCWEKQSAGVNVSEWRSSNLVLLHLKLYMILQNTLNYLHDFRKLKQNCSRTEIYQWPSYLLGFFHEIFTILWVFYCSLQKFNNFVGKIFQVSGATTRICWLSCQSSMQYKIRNKFIRLKKVLNAENIPATAIAQAPVQKKLSLKRILAFFIFPEKIT